MRIENEKLRIKNWGSWESENLGIWESVNLEI
jgi:hypothetical protein